MKESSVGMEEFHVLNMASGSTHRRIPAQDTPEGTCEPAKTGPNL